MAKRPAKKNPLPEWFNLSKYEQLPDLTNLDLFNEVSLRIMTLESNKETAIDSAHLAAWNDMLLSGEVRLYRFWALYMMALSGKNNKTPFIKRLGRVVLNQKKPSAKMDYPYSGQMVPLLSKHIFPLDYLATIPADRPIHHGLVNVGISLGNATDAEILAEFTRLLPVWRQHLAMPEPAKHEAGKAGASTIKRIIEYKVIPMLDLMLWAKTSGFEYSAEQLSRVLFQEDIVTAKQMTDTRIPFALNFSDADYNDMMSLWLRQNGADGNINGNRLARDELPVT